MLDHLALVKAAEDMAPLPATVTRLTALLGRPSYSTDDVAAIVRLDPPLTGRILQYANSAASASANTIGTVQDAIVRIGIGPVLSMATAASVRRDLMKPLPEYGLAEGELWQHSIASALASELIARSVPHDLPAEAFTASLLHDVGKILLARFLEAETQEWLEAARAQSSASGLSAEVEVLGVNHGELGGLIAEHWKLPARIVVGITHHHVPAAGADIICDVVNLADVLAKRAGVGRAATPADLEVDAGTLTRLGIEARRLETLTERLGSQIADMRARFE